MKTTKLMIIALLMCALITPVSAIPYWKDTVERYTPDYTELWDKSIVNDAHGGEGVVFSSSVAPTAYPYADTHCLSVSASEYLPNSCAASTAVKLTSKEYIYSDYYSFTVRKLTKTDSNQGTGSHTAQVSLIDSGGAVVASYTFPNYDSVERVYEIVESGNTAYLYLNGEQVGVISNGLYSEGIDYKVQFYTFTQSPGWKYGFSTQLYIDDLSTESCTGIYYTYDEYSTLAHASYRVQGLAQHLNYNYKLNLISMSEGVINSTSLSTATPNGYVTWDITNILGENYDVYMVELTRDSVTLDRDYFVYSLSTDPIDYPELLLYATSNADMEIRDADNNGGIISSGGSVYLYPNNASGVYPVRYTLQGAPYSFTAALNAVYGNSLINSTPFTFSGLSNNYVVTLDGESLAGTKASGDLIFSDNVTDGETVTIGSDVYEFESTGGVTGGNIQVNIGNVTQTAENLTTAINTAGLSAVSASVVETPASSSYYYSDIEITSNPGIADYQAKVTIPFETGMNTDFSNIRLFDSDVSIPYWVESKTDSVSAVVWIPISAGSDIQCRWGISGETASESDGSEVFIFFDSFDVFSGWSRILGSGSVTGTMDGTSTIGVFSGANDRFTKSLGSSLSGSYTVGASARYPESSVKIICGLNPDTWAGWSAITSSYEIYEYKVTTTGSRTDFLFGTLSDGGTVAYVDYLYVRKYAATEPTLSVGVAQVSAESASVTPVHIVSDSIGVASNSITTTETCTYAAFEAETLTGGSGGSIVNTPTWSYEITDWTNLTTHIFSFSPDLTVPGVYGYVKDVSTQAAIQSATVTVVGPNSTQYVYTDENGFYYLTNGMELNEQYTVSAAKSGYTQGVSFTVSTTAGATTRKDLLLDALSSTDGVYYANHYVKLVVVDKSWHKLNATMTVSSANGTLCTNEVLGTDGALTLKMTEDIKYTIKTTYNGATQTDYITPADTIYYIIWDAASATLVPEQFYEYVNIDIAKEIVSPTEAYINITYTDGKTDTNPVNFVLGQYAENGTFIVLQTSPTFSVNCTTGFTVNDYTGETYVIKANINHGTFGTITKYYSVAFTGSNLPFTGKALAYFGIFILFIVAFQFGKAEHASGAIMLCGVCWLFWYVGIFEAFGTTINTTMCAGLSLATIYSLATYINEKRREEGV